MTGPRIAAVSLLLVAATVRVAGAQTTTSTSSSTSRSTSTSSTTSTTLQAALDCFVGTKHALATLTGGVLRCHSRGLMRTVRNRPFVEEECLAPYREAAACQSSNAPSKPGKADCRGEPLRNCPPACDGVEQPDVPALVRDGLVVINPDATGKDRRRALRCGRKLDRRLATLAVALANCRIEEGEAAQRGEVFAVQQCEQMARDAFALPGACSRRPLLGQTTGTSASLGAKLGDALDKTFCPCPRPGGILCDDQNPCTHDYCDGVECRHVARAGSCAAGGPCTEGVCSEGVCTQRLRAGGGACPDKCQECNSAGACVPIDVNARCLDTDPCTQDTCEPARGCVHRRMADFERCVADANACTLDWCAGGACVAHPVNCTDPTVPTECQCPAP